MINLIVKIKKNLLKFYDNNLAFTKFGDLYSNLENIIQQRPSNSKFIEFESSNPIDITPFLIATTSQGLLLYFNGKIKKLFKEKGFYGITKLSNKFYAFHKTGMHGNIISFKLKNNKAIENKIIIKGLSRGIHQIDFINDDLYVTNTYDNSILVYKDAKDRENIYWKRFDDIIYPNGKLKNGRFSKNYNHFNSIFKYKNDLHIIAHNETKKTNRKSEIYTIKNFKTKNITKQKINGSNCHNIYINQNQKIYCKSLEGILSINDKDVISHKDIFTRGLSVCDKYIILGGSDIQLNREKRDKTKGYIYIYNLELKLLQKISIQNTQIQEIKLVNNEKTFSNYIS